MLHLINQKHQLNLRIDELFLHTLHDHLRSIDNWNALMHHLRSLNDVSHYLHLWGLKDFAPCEIGQPHTLFLQKIKKKHSATLKSIFLLPHVPLLHMHVNDHVNVQHLLNLTILFASSILSQLLLSNTKIRAFVL